MGTRSVLCGHEAPSSLSHEGSDLTLHEGPVRADATTFESRLALSQMGATAACGSRPLTDVTNGTKDLNLEFYISFSNFSVKSHTVAVTTILDGTELVAQGPMARELHSTECEPGHGPARDEGWRLSLGVQTTGLVEVSVTEGQSVQNRGEKKSASPHFSNASENLV